MFCARLCICVLWSPAGKGLTSWLSFVVSSVSLSLSHWYPGSGVVLDCIDSWSLQPYLLCFILLSSKNDESDGIKTFEVYSSCILLASNIFKQKKNINLCYGLYRRKIVTFWNEGTFSLASSVQEVHVIFKWNNLQSLGKVLLHLKHDFFIPYVSLSVRA